MGKRDIGKEIIQGLEEIKAWKRGDVKLKSFISEMPRASEVPVIRKGLGLSQPEFARFMGVSVATLRNWEQERREPQGPARALLLVAKKQPQAVIKAFKSSTRVARKKTDCGKIPAMKATIDAAWRIVVPKALRQALGLKPGQPLDIRAGDGYLEIEIASTNVKLTKRGKGMVAVPDTELPPLTAEQVRDTLERTRG